MKTPEKGKEAPKALKEGGTGILSRQCTYIVKGVRAGIFAASIGAQLLTTLGCGARSTTDEHTHAGEGSDAGPDVYSDAGHDVYSDEGPCIGPDEGPCIGPDAGSGVEPDAGPCIGPDAGPCIGPDAGPAVDSDAGL